MNNTALIHCTAVTPDSELQDAVILIDQGRITYVGAGRDVHIPGNYRKIDLENRLVTPGFIDLHNNGGGGVLVMDGTYDAICKVAAAHAKFGTTGFLPTTVAWSDEEQIGAIRASVDAARRGTGSAKVLGIHMEGPFLNPSKGGAHNPAYLVAPSVEKFERFLEASEGYLKLLTLSPELSGAESLIAAAVQRDVRVSAGHTTASIDHAHKSIDAGIRLCAHVMNAMNGISARDPGLATAFLTDDRTMVELIADGVHVHPRVIELVLRAKSSDRVILVTDSTPPSGTDMVSWELEGQKVMIRGFTGYLENGTIAGSALTLGAAVKLMKEFTGRPLHEIVKMASINAAKLLGIDDRKGSLLPGRDADFVVMSPDTLSVEATVVEGVLVHGSL